MKIAIYGGSFDPPHTGHVTAADRAGRVLKADKMLIMPACTAPHKQAPEDGASPADRLEMAKLAFGGIDGAEVSDLEILRGGKSYTSDTVHQMRELYPDAELVLLVGTDMLKTLSIWHEADYILKNVTVAAFSRDSGDERAISAAAEELRSESRASVIAVDSVPFPVSSSAIRGMLKNRQGREELPESVYAYIIARRLYGAKPEFEWLREQAYAMLAPKRVPHVRGCEGEAVRLAERWGADKEKAAEAGILHDITKKLVIEEQLLLCEKYGIMVDDVERTSPKLLHSKTGAAIAKAVFGMPDDVSSAICWHTTGRPDMTLLEKIIYMADYIEPNRDFPGVEELRALAYENLDKAMRLGLQMTLDEITAAGVTPHKNSVSALEWYSRA